MNPIAIFKPGQFQALNGLTYNFTEADVKATANAYDPGKHDAPLVIGHPKTNSPAYGWTTSLSFADGLLKAIPRAVSTQFSEWVNSGLYKKISASFYPPDAPTNPVPGVFYLKHIGFLGAVPPAVKGLPDANFGQNDNELISIEFSEFTSTEFTEDVCFAAPSGYEVDIGGLQLHKRALAYQSQNQCDYRTAVIAVS